MFRQADIEEKQKLIQNVPPRHHASNGSKQKSGRRELIISLTSIPSRMDDMHIAIYSLLNQTCEFDRLILWLGDEFFPQGESGIPAELIRMKQFGLEIRFRKDIGPYTKLVYALREFPEADIVTADDDYYYPETWLQQLIDAHEKHPKDIIAHRCHGILLDPGGNVKKYSEWRFERVDFQRSYRNFLTGVGGVLYPAHALHPDASNEALFRELSQTNDDVWFWTMALLNRRKIFCINSPYVSPEFINLARHLGNDGKPCLHFLNVGQRSNDQYLQNIFQHYPHLKDLLRKQEMPAFYFGDTIHTIRHIFKMFLPYGLIRFYQKQTYGENFSPMNQPQQNLSMPIKGGRFSEMFSQNLEILNRQSFLISEMLEKKIDCADVSVRMQDNIAKMLSLPEDGCIPIVFITDSGYLTPTLVAISSLFRNRNPRTRYQVYVIGVDLKQKEKESFSVFSSAVKVLDFCSDSDFANAVPDHTHVSKAALFKFRLPEIFPNDQKILYLDSDMIIKGDLSELWRTDVSQVYAAAVLDARAMRNKCHMTLGVEKYFNSGMMLLNLDLMRRKNLTEKLIDTKKRSPYKTRFMDQDEFNYVFKENILPVSPKYNCMYANNVGLGEKDLACYDLSYREYQHCMYSPVILHMTNRDKPWDSPLALRYTDYKTEEYYFRALAGKFRN